MKSKKRFLMTMSACLVFTLVMILTGFFSFDNVNAENIKIGNLLDLQLSDISQNSEHSNIKFNKDGSFTLLSKSSVPKSYEGAVSYGTLTSKTLKVNKEFNGAVVKLTKKGVSQNVEIEIRASKDGSTWTQWYAAHFGDNEEINFQGDYSHIQYAITLIAYNEEDFPEIKNISIKLKESIKNKENSNETKQPTNSISPQVIENNLVSGIQQLSVSNPYTVSCYATREYMIGGITANNHVIKETDIFVALPSKTSLNRTDKTFDYTVDITYNGKTMTNIPVWDIGPYNEYDDYWNVTGVRDKFGYSTYDDLSRGVSEEYAAYNLDFHHGWTSSHRIAGYVMSYNSDTYPGTQVHNYKPNPDYPNSTLRNNGGEIDLSEGVWKGLGLTDNSMVSVTFNWVSR